MYHFTTFTPFNPPLIHLQSNYNNHYNEVHYLTEDARGKALDDIESRRIQLGQLAGQLSGLIGGGEEVKDAIVKGLHSNVNQLIKRLQASCGGEGCCKVDEAIKKLNDANETLKNKLKDDQNASKNLVNILSECNLNGPNGPLKELKTSITQKIQELNQRIEELKKQDEQLKKENKSPQNASQIDKLSKDLQSHQASKKSLQTLKELCDFAGKINEKHFDDNNCKNLLENLCTGLEKFLGYDNGNYTGEGIVYSDLDRLCDGVMAFLHGVLSNIKPKLGLHKDEINNAITSLNLHKHSGKDGFNAAIVKVVEGEGGKLGFG
ncbi:hypothetical protein, conserved [Babesia ovata]|uniref:Extracellular matrix-binding ebh n=1 Tax=Babesia ovata TaxID=189622 RepID=A0A2H6KJF7_9APIC|nr:uncharacterized protein BOVATA_046030 [Babesia ovata]GBE63110.1 hypothetical protein, conserved [Babesia ovata]